MNMGFLDLGKRNNNHRKKTNTDISTGWFTESDGMRNDANPLKEVVLPSVDELVAMEVQSPLVDQTNAVKTVRESYPSLPTQGSTPTGRGDEVDVVVPVESIRAVSDRFANSAYGFFLRKRVAYPVVANYVRNTWDKFGLVGSTFSSSTGLFSFQFSSMDGLNAMLENGTWSSYAKVMIELWADVELKDTIVVECPKNPGLGAGAGATKKKPSQAQKGIRGNKKKSVDSTNMVSDLNPFDVLNSIDNDVEMAILVDEAGNPLKKVEYPGDHDSEDEVASVDNDMIHSLASEKTGFGTKSLLEQWRDSYGNSDYDEDPYDDDIYEGQDLSEEIQTICDKLDIRV
ncbi:hypothetical protein Tco_1401940 [Tanacetum coccineum]